MTRVVAAIIGHAGTLLICRRRASGLLPLKWEFPGGKMRPSESPREALAREAREELAIELLIGAQLCRVRHAYREFHSAVEISFFAASLLDKGPFIWPRNLAFQSIRWVRREELAKYDFLAADRPVIRGLIQGELRTGTV